MKNNFDRINADCGEKTWLTPKWIVDALGHFDVDPCVPDRMPWRTADRMISKAEDGLATPWGGGARIWLNPPYGKDAIPFLRKMREHVADNGGSGCCLIFGRTETKYFKEEIFPFADSLFFITGRLRFCNADGEPQGTCALPNVIVSYTKADTRIVARSGIDGALFKPVDRNGVV